MSCGPHARMVVWVGLVSRCDSCGLKKRVLRTVLVEIVADLLDDPARVSLRFHWAGGVHTHLLIPKNRTGQHRHTTDREVMDLMRDLAKVCDDPRCRPSGRTPRRSCGPW